MDARMRAAKLIVDFEARRDRQGHLKVYELPPGDGGGRYEVAGINEKYNKPECDHLVRLLAARKYNQAETYACEVIARNTDAAEKWHKDPGVLFFLRDCVFNRGVHGAARILQWSVGLKGEDERGVVQDDGIVGSKTRRAISEVSPDRLLAELRKAREDYEREVVGYRKTFWEGLENRWDKALVAARDFDDAGTATA